MGVLTLTEIRKGAAAKLFPLGALNGCDNALVLFAAAFHGRQDAVWIAEAGMRATCVDKDGAKLNEMILAYPEGWEYVTGDVFDYALKTERSWDAVTLDPPSNLFDRCAELLPVWCLLARRTVILGSEHDREFDVPYGWKVTDRLWRSRNYGGTCWAVLQRQ